MKSPEQARKSNDARPVAFDVHKVAEPPSNAASVWRKAAQDHRTVWVREFSDGTAMVCFAAQAHGVWYWIPESCVDDSDLSETVEMRRRVAAMNNEITGGDYADADYDDEPSPFDAEVLGLNSRTVAREFERQRDSRVLAGCVVVGGIAAFVSMLTFLYEHPIVPTIFAVYLLVAFSWFHLRRHRRNVVAALDRRNTELRCNAIVQHQHYLEGDDFGIYGHYTPAKLED